MDACNRSAAFDQILAAGLAGMWNYTQPKETKGNKKETPPPIDEAQPDPKMFEEFLRLRDTEDGRTLRDLFHEPETLPDGWSRFQFKQYK